MARRAVFVCWYCLSTMRIASLLLLAGIASAQADAPIHVFILAGQSNMQGKGFPEPVAYQVTDDKFKDRWTTIIQDGDHAAFGKAAAQDPPVYPWAERDDVYIDLLGKHGPLTVGYGAPAKTFGPELGFGEVVGDYLDAPVLIIKTAWGGKSIARDFVSPSGKIPTDEEFEAMAAEKNKQTEQHNEKHPDRKRDLTTADAIKQSYGHYYREMISNVKRTLGSLDRFPELKGKEYHLAGFCWFQGWNDQYNEYWLDYEANMKAFIQDVRKDLEAPYLPFVVGVVGFDGHRNEPLNKDGSKKPRTYIQEGQRAMAKLFPESVATVETAQYWDMEADAVYFGEGGWQKDVDNWRRYGNDRPYHYLGSPWFFYQTGKGFGDAMLEVMYRDR